MRITLNASGTPPAEQIRDQISGLIAAGRLTARERLPSVRQLAADLGVAPGTVAKAYRALEADGYLTTTIGAGTRVSERVEGPPAALLEAARRLTYEASAAGTDVEGAVRILRAVWPDGR